MRLRGNSSEAILSLITRTEKEGGLAGSSFGKQTASVLGHAGLYAAMFESLAFLDESAGGDDMFIGHRDDDGDYDELFSADYEQFERKPVSARYAALEAMDKSSGKFSFSILAQLWHLRSADDAEELSLLFANVGLGQIEQSARRDEEDVFILHDSQYDFCRGAARKLSVNGHLLLLSGCVLWLGREQDWASFCFSLGKNGCRESQLEVRTHSLSLHLGRHLFRHLSRAAVMADESNATAIAKVMVGLLTDFCWIRGRGAAHGRVGVLLDFKMALSACTGGTCTYKYPSISAKIRESISLIWRVLQLAPEAAFWSTPTGDEGLLDERSAGECARGICDCELAIHILGQLHQALIDGWDAKVDVVCVQKLMRSIEKNTRQGWLRARNGCFQHLPNDKRLFNVFTVGRGESPVRCVAALGDGTHVVSVCRGIVRIHNFITSETVLSFGNGEVEFVTTSETARKDYLIISGGGGVCVTKVAQEVDGSFRVVDSSNLDTRRVANVSMSRNGDKVVAVFSEEPFGVSIWTCTSDDSELCYSKSVSFPCNRSISNLTLSPEGDWIVSTEGSQILFWPKNPTILVSQGHFNSVPGDSISSIAFSKDARR